MINQHRLDQTAAARVNGMSRRASRARGVRRGASRRGFTLIELLVVILIILLVSAVTLPVVLPAMSHRQVSEAARLVQGALVGARDAALHNGTISGIRLLPDPAFPLLYLPNGQLDPTQPLAANRIIPIEAAPEYSEGMLGIYIPSNGFAIPYPVGPPAGVYPITSNGAGTIGNVLMVKEIVADTTNGLNEPTTWFWNIRVGDKLQINDSGLWYTVVGPMVITPQQGNSELFVNCGEPGTGSPLIDFQVGFNVNPEFLFLVNGLDDNQNGWIDEGWDGVDNNLNFELQNNAAQVKDDLLEWETETWPSAVAATAGTSQKYTIQRRPTPVATSRELSLPSNVVIDLSMLLGSPSQAQAPLWQFAERSQFPQGVINPYTGYVDIMLYPNGTVVPSTIYSTPSSYGMSGAFFHMWLAERSDVRAHRLETRHRSCRSGTSSSSSPARGAMALTGGRRCKGSTGS